MLKIISSKLAARKTIKAQLQKEIPPTVEDWNLWDVKAKISWYDAYSKLSDNDSEVEKLAKELDLEIVEIEVQKPQKSR